MEEIETEPDKNHNVIRELCTAPPSLIQLQEWADEMDATRISLHANLDASTGPGLEDHIDMACAHSASTCLSNTCLMHMEYCLTVLKIDYRLKYGERLGLVKDKICIVYHIPPPPIEDPSCGVL